MGATSVSAMGRPAVSGGLPRPPGPRGLEWIKWAARAPGDLYGWLPALAAEYGDVVDLPIPVRGMTVTLLSHPDHVDHIMTRHHSRYRKVHFARELVAGEPPALPLLEGQEWKRVRRTMNPHFGEKALAGVSPLMMAAVEKQVDTWVTHARAGATVDLEVELGVVVMAGLLRSMFSVAADQDTLRRWVTATHDYGAYVVRRMTTVALPGWLPHPRDGRGAAAKTFLTDQLDAMIEQRRASPRSGEPDLLDVVLSMEFEGGPHLQYARMRSELAGLVFAGFETTAEALAWTIALLCRNPRALGRAYAELDALDHTDDGGGTTSGLGYAQLARLGYLRACFDEGQRVQAALINVRTANEDDEIGGYLIPAGSHVVISPYGLHHDPRFWRDPHTFEPNRFLTDEINRNAFIPFNIGPRKCMGSRMAYIEGVLTLAAILRRYSIELRDGWSPKHQIRVSTGLAGGLPARIHTR